MNEEKVVEECNRLIIMTCMLLNVQIPDIYYVTYLTDTDIVLRDSCFQIISYDQRDIGYYIQSMNFNNKEYVIYINTALFDKVLKRRVICFREVRRIFQIKEVQCFIDNDQSMTVESSLARRWLYALRLPGNNYTNSPILNDCYAFAYLMMKWVFHIDVDFVNIDKQRFEECYNQICQSIDMNRVDELFYSFYKM